MPNLFARDKKTFERHIRQGGGFLKPGRPQVSLSERVLHYVGSDRSIVCRCAAPKGHYLQTLSVTDDSEHLNASLIIYMDRFGYESCKIAKFNTYQGGQKAMWQKLGVHISDFHYTNKEKGRVCRCINPGSHSYGAVRNPEIIELCAKFFEHNDDKCACNKQEWRGNYHQSHAGPLGRGSQSVDDCIQHSTVQEQGFSGYSRRSGSRGPSLWNGSDRGSATSVSTRAGSPRSTFGPSIHESRRSHASQVDLLTPPQQMSVGTHSSRPQRDTSAVSIN